MLRRCYDTEDADYNNYGGKGVEVCEEWRNSADAFEKWALSHGYASDLTIDRMDPNKNYCPENCRWITASDNARYKSTTNYITINGVTKSGREWSNFLMLGPNTINTMLREDGEKKTYKFIKKRLENPFMYRYGSQSWMDVYHIES